MIVKLSGGLGNQMFQYAFGKAAALQTGLSVVYDYSAILNDKNPLTTRRNYELEVFACEVPLVKKRSVTGMLVGRENLIKKVLFKLADSLGLIRMIKDPHPFCFDARIIHGLDRRSYVEGYFQTQLYFASFEEEIRRCFTFQREMSANSVKYRDKIMGCNAVAIHIRRGDYANNPEITKIYGCCSDSYYEESIRLVTEHVKNPHFFIFSDEQEWVKKQGWFSNSQVTFVEGNSGSYSYEDMWLMSLCKHNIIANSSFSWWGAWLNGNKEKLVIAPAKWFADAARNAETTDLIPGTWLRI
jgi:hypothetical protein